MGSVGEHYSVQRETQAIFEGGILNNPLLPSLPPEIKEAGKLVTFVGNDLPSIPINWKFAESAAALKAFEASMLNVLRAKKYGAKFSEVSIDTDHASLFIMTPFMGQLVKPDGEAISFDPFSPKTLVEYGYKNQDLHRATASMHRRLTTNIYRTKDGRFYHVHGEMHAFMCNYDAALSRTKQA